MSRILIFFVVALFELSPALAADANRDIKGPYLLTDYPAVTVQPGIAEIPLVRLAIQQYS
jgi:hypothetical protein